MSDPSSPNSRTIERRQYRATHPEQRAAERKRRRIEHPEARLAERQRAAWRGAFQFLTVDGEATSDGKFILLGCSDGTSIEDSNGLSTIRCLQYLTTRTQRYLWFFAGDYDVNQILNGLDATQLTLLAARNRCYFGDFRIVHLPGKMFRITDRESNQTTTCWDAYSFIRTSFARWLRDWKITGPAELEFIEKMKEGRAAFSLEQMPEIRRYNMMELDLLHRAVTELLGRIQSGGYKPTSFHSPGSVSAAVMRHFHVKEHKGGLPPRAAAAAQAAYYGGRFETRFIGMIPGPLYHYDINSAYPSAAADLPCLACGTWKRASTVDLDESGHLVYVTWQARTPYRNPADRQPFGPFPVRIASGSLRYPITNPEGGWYWSQEAGAARAATNLKVHGAWRFVPGCEHRPFAFIPELYAMRQKLKEAGDPAEYCFKLILNSCYGKLAQRPRSPTDKPAFYEPAWAGSITAITRGKLLSAISLDAGSIIQTATDGLTCRRPLDLPLSKALGEWDLKELDLLLVVQSGIYFWKEKGGKTMQRSRGFHPASLTFDRCADHLTHHPGEPLTLHNRRFIGYRTALHRGNLATWRTWSDYDAHLGTNPEPRRELIGRVRGLATSAPPIQAIASALDQVADPFAILEAWELEQPDGPEGDSL